MEANPNALKWMFESVRKVRVSATLNQNISKTLAELE